MKKKKLFKKKRQLLLDRDFSPLELLLCTFFLLVFLSREFKQHQLKKKKKKKKLYDCHLIRKKQTVVVFLSLL